MQLLKTKVKPQCAASQLKHRREKHLVPKASAVSGVEIRLHCAGTKELVGQYQSLTVMLLCEIKVTPVNNNQVVF